MQVPKAGIYPGMPMHHYVSDPAPKPSINTTAARAILTQSPFHAWTQHPRLNPNYQDEESSRLDLGTIAHSLLLEKDATGIEIIRGFDDWKKKAAQEARDAARAAGKIPVLEKDHKMVLEMVVAAMACINGSEIGEAWHEAIPEQTLIWEDNGVWCRSRTDKATPSWDVSFDYKTTEGCAHPDVWSRGCMLRYGYDLQCALAQRGIQHLVQPVRTTFIFVVQEMDPPYAVSLVALAPDWLAIAHEKIRTAMSIWKGCMRTQQWPGYPKQVAYVEAPPYAENSWSACLPEIEAEDLV